MTSLTKLYDKKLMEEKHNVTQSSLLTGEGIPYVDDSPEKRPFNVAPPNSDKKKVGSDEYRNPSLHKNQFTTDNNSTCPVEMNKFKEESSKKLPEKDEDSTMIEENLMKTTTKLKRSESLNKPERTSPQKLKRSESLNKTAGGDKLKRSDSLTKNEKTESNLNKKREISTSGRRSKDSKLKRKNGMPDRSIKRRHTVGGTKDPDKVTWLDNKYQEEVNKENKEKNLRTSSPDLSSSRRERLFFEINLIGPENVVMALKQNLMGARPQSFPDTAVFKIPLESHV